MPSDEPLLLCIKAIKEKSFRKCGNFKYIPKDYLITAQHPGSINICKFLQLFCSKNSSFDV